MLGYLLSPVLQIEDINGIPLTGGKIYVYRANTSDLATIYSNYEGTLSTNPVILDELGHATIITDDETLYDITVKDSSNNLIMSAEDVAVGGEGGSATVSDVTVRAGGNGIKVVQSVENNIKVFTVSIDYDFVASKSDLNNKQDKLGPLNAGVNIMISNAGVIDVKNQNANTTSNSVAFGTGCSALGRWAFAHGYNTLASGANSYSHAEGSTTSAFANNSHTEGNRTVCFADNTHAEGSGTSAIGGISHSEGYATVARGTASHAEGRNTVTSGQGSHAEGYQTSALNENSHSEGSTNVSYGNASHTEGRQNLTSGYGSHAEGYMTSAVNDQSHSEGVSTYAVGNGAHTEGYQTSAIAQRSHAEGHSTLASAGWSHTEGVRSVSLAQYSHAEGSATSAVGSYSHAEGNSAYSNGIGSHAEGRETSALGRYSHAEGQGTIASGDCSHAEGNGTTAFGNWSHAAGDHCLADGWHAHAEGLNTSAYGSNSLALGSYTVTSGSNSIAAGNGVSALGLGQVVLGRYNLPNSNDILQIGCGIGDIGDQRRNAIEVRNDLSVWYHYNNTMYNMRPYSAGDGITINDYVIESHPSVPKHGGYVAAGNTGSVSYTAMAGDTFQIQLEKESGNYLGNIKVHNTSDLRYMYGIINYNGTPVLISESQTVTVLSGITDYGIAHLDIVGMGVGNEIPRCSFTISYNVKYGELYYTIYDEYLY